MVSEPDSVHVSCGLLIISLASELVAAVERSLSRRHALALFGPIRTFDPRNLSWLGPTTQGAQGEVCRARAVLRIVSSFKQLLRLRLVCTMRHMRPARPRIHPIHTFVASLRLFSSGSGLNGKARGGIVVRSSYLAER